MWQETAAQILIYCFAAWLIWQLILVVLDPPSASSAKFLRALFLLVCLLIVYLAVNGGLWWPQSVRLKHG